MDFVIWTISYGPYHMDHIVWTISYGAYFGAKSNMKMLKYHSGRSRSFEFIFVVSDWLDLVSISHG